MTRRQIIPEQWLILDRRPTDCVWGTVRRLPRGSGILVIIRLRPVECRRLRNLANLRDFETAIGGRSAARVHDMRELRRALLVRSSLILLSPLYPTQSHPDWMPLPRMRAATYARLTKRTAIALGGMNVQRYAKIAPLGFIGWAGISAFRT